MNCSVLRKYYLIFALFSFVSLQSRADVTNEVVLSFTSALTISNNQASATVGDITFTFSGSNLSTYSDHVTLGSGDLVKVAQASGSGSTITGITFYMSGVGNGALSLNGGEKDKFKSNAWSGSATMVQFKNNNSNKSVSIQAIVVKYTKTSSVSFSAQEETYSLKNLFVGSTDNVSTATTTTSGATVKYFVLNTSVAKTDETSAYLRFVNDGWATVQATDATKSSDNTYPTTATNTAYYAVHITTQEIDPTDYVSGNVLDMSSVKTEGEIDATSVKLPYMTIGIGSTSETAVLKNLGTTDSPRMGMVCLDANGFNHAYLDDNKKMGTYFTFTPLTKGTLTVKGYFNQNGSGNNEPAHLYLDGSSIATISFDASAQEELTYSLEAGKTYYLYVPTTNNKYDYFCPNYISFVSDFYYSTKSVKVSNGTTSCDLQKPNGVTSSTTYSAVAKGALTNASVDASTGKVSWSVDNTKGDGGAIVVKASDNGSSDFYVITVPYTTHTWSFINPVPNWTTMKNNTSDWQFYYKNRQHADDGTLTYISGPYVSNATGFDGINAYYMDETAGLLIKAGAQAFGSDVLSSVNEPATNDEKIKQPYTNVSTVTKLTLQEGASLTIPNLKAGYHVRMRWLRYAPQNGDLVSVTNLNDLEGTEITKLFRVGSTVGGTTKFGYQEFVVKSDGDVTFTMQQEGPNRGYVDIEEIQVAKDFIKTDLRISTNSKNFYDSYYYAVGQTPTVTLYGDRCQSSLAPSFTVAKKDKSYSSDINYVFSNNTITMKAGQGVFTVTAKAYSQPDHGKNGTSVDQQEKGGKLGTYMLDEVAQVITVYEYATTTQTYPYTWDFKKYSASHFTNMATTTSGTTSDLWTVDNSSSKAKYTLNRKSWNCVLGDELRDANGNAVAETEGLGFSAVRGSGSSLVYRTGDDISFGTVADTIHIPTVPSGYKVYMLIKNGSGSVMVGNQKLEPIVDGVTGLTNDDFKKSYGGSDWKIYTIDGADNTIDVALSNVQLKVIAVTNAFKNFNHLDGMDKSYATEYRNIAERYDLTELFTNGVSPVTAYYVSSVNDKLATTQKIGVAPAKTGVILSTTNTSAPQNVPLFVPDVNSTTETVTGNMLKGVLTAQTVTAPGQNNVNYFFTPYYYNTDEGGNTSETQHTKGTLAFYRQINNDQTQLGANKAYLQIPKSASAKQYIFLSFIENGDAATAILLPQAYAGEKDVYYTLTGQRLPQRPVMPGIYVRNGKKILVK